MSMNTDDSAMKIFHPIQLTWSHGAVIGENAEQLSCRVHMSKEEPTKVGEIVVEHGQSIFLGKRNESPLTNNYVVLRNRKTNQLRWYKTASFLMQPQRPKSLKKETIALEDQESRRAAISNLNKTMGSKKIKRRVLESEKTDVATENLEEKLKNAIDDQLIIVEKPATTSVVQKFSYIPPRNANASSIQDVYQLNDLLSSDIMDSLKEIAEQITNSDIITLAADERLTSFFMRCYGCLQSPDATKVKLLLFADCLMKFVKEPARNLKLKSLAICKYSTSLNAKILNEFCDLGLGNIRQRSPSMRDKAFCYILVSLFLALNFVVNINLFTEHVGTSDYQRLPSLMRAVGATKEKDSSTGFKLKLPLAELPTTQGGRKGGSYKKKTMIRFNGKTGRKK